VTFLFPFFVGGRVGGGRLSPNVARASSPGVVMDPRTMSRRIMPLPIPSRVAALAAILAIGGGCSKLPPPQAAASAPVQRPPILATTPMVAGPSTPAMASAEARALPVEPGPGWLGVSLSARTANEPGVLVSGVLRGSPAAVHGLEVGDVVVGVNDERVGSPEELSQLIARLGARGRANQMLLRQDESRLLGIQLAAKPGLEGQLRLGFLNLPAPELDGVAVAQGNVGPTLQALRGQVIVLEFWATWCGACRGLMPVLNDWHARLLAQGGLVLSITTDPLELATRSASELGLTYPVLSDPNGITATSYQAFAVPTLFVIDRAGVVRDVAVGYDRERLEALEALLARLASES
jgi:peroxiredoxin